MGVAWLLIATRPSGLAMMVSGPFMTVTAPVRAAACRAAATRSGPGPPNTRENSPICGVMMAAPFSRSGCPAAMVNAPASAITSRPACTSAGKVAATSSTDRPGPQTQT